MERAHLFLELPQVGWHRWIQWVKAECFLRKKPTFSGSCRRLGRHLWIQKVKRNVFWGRSSPFPEVIADWVGVGVYKGVKRECFLFYYGWCPPFPGVVAGCHRQMEGLRPAVRTGWHRKTRRLLSSRHTSHPDRTSLLKMTTEQILCLELACFFTEKCLMGFD